jgi:hypothetical protein
VSAGADLDVGVYRIDDSPLELAGTKGGASMPTYVSLLRWTEQGIKNYKDTLSRVEDVSKLAESLGGRLREVL